MKQIINSILDTDLYKITMMMAVIKKFPFGKVRYSFINRGGTPFPEGFDVELRKQVKLMEKLHLTSDEKKWLLETCNFLEPWFIDTLSGYKYDSSEVGIIQRGNKLEIVIEGYWWRTIMWEVPLMAIISELFFIMTNQMSYDLESRTEIVNNKINTFLANNIHYADFGTRRRFSYDNHKEVITQMAKSGLSKDLFVGTSNLHLAHILKIKPIGTHAHEWFMYHAGKYGYKMANYLAMENWVDVYRGNLGIALSDTFTTDVFFKSFDKKFAKLFDGVRQDSGDPFIFADKTIDHYKSLGIDPKSKTIIFSDGLDPENAIDINNYCGNDIKVSFGIGTNFTNDVGVIPLNMVIKMTAIKPEKDIWHNTIKLSDSLGKHTGPQKDIEIAKYVLNIN